ncbi:MAG TPA: DUF2029 domain-containing protein [Rhizobiales bacterium]|nr:DUF2029 domain-containing protein [Hyphomicrobiales bacterium]
MRFFSRLAPPYRVVAIAAPVLLAVHVTALVWALIDPETPATIADKDFANYWMAGRLVHEGRFMDLFGPQSVYFSHLADAFGADFPWHNWSYPPHYLLLVWPLGFLSYEVAMLLFLLSTGTLFLLALRGFARQAGPIAWVSAGPFVAHNFWAAQNGYLTAALALGALGLRDRRPVLAGVLLGLLTVKPQLGLLFPFLLVAERRWSMIASAASTTLALVGGSAVIFGIDAWKGYLDEVVPYQSLVMRALEGTFLLMMPSVFGALRGWHVASDTALALHLFVAVPVALATSVAFFRVADAHYRTALFLLASIIVTPYALSYDMGTLVPALALLAAGETVAGSGGRSRAALLAIAMLLPVLMIPFGSIGIPLAAPVLLAVYVLTLAEARMFGRISAPSQDDVGMSPSSATAP